MGIYLHHGAVSTGFGDHPATQAALERGESAVIQPNCFGVDAAWAAFRNQNHRNITDCIASLAQTCPIETDSTRCSTALIFAAAKGSGSGLDELAQVSQSSVTVSPLLHNQAHLAAVTLGLDQAPRLVISNACASGAVAIDTAVDLVEHFGFDQVLLVGYDAVSRFVATGFSALGALSQHPARPFDRDRSGLSLGDGAAMSVVRRFSTHPGAEWVRIAGTGVSNDANHRTGPSRTGEGLYRAAAQALNRAQIAPKRIGAVKCHGTATPYNDAMEAKALYTLFGKECPPCVSIKGSLGHTSGSGSLMECLIASQWLLSKNIPPTVGFLNLGVDEPIAISSSPQTFAHDSLLCLSAGFGGINAAVVLSASEGE